MTKPTLPLVTPIGVNSIKLDSPYWFQWLEQCKSFRYKSSIAEYTCIKRSNSKWYAVKKQRGSRHNKQEYIGADSKCSLAKLEEISRLFALPDKDYWYLKYSKPEQGQNQPSSHGDTSQECTTIDQDTLQLLEKIIQLRVEADRLKTSEQYLHRYIAELEAESTKVVIKQNTSALEIDSLNAEIAILQESLAIKQTEIELLKNFRSFPDLTKLNTYKLHGEDVVRTKDLVQLLTEQFGEL